VPVLPKLLAGVCVLALAAGCGKSREAVADDPGGNRPGIPRIVSPANGGYTGSVRHRRGEPRRPVFEWTAVRFDAPVSYDIELDADCKPGKLQKCPFGTPERRVTGLVHTRWQPSKPLPVSANIPLGRRYYWRLRACSGARCSPWSRVRYIEVGRTRGDFNGDGYSDVAVGAPLIDGGGRDRGAVFVYYGRRSGVARGARIDDPGHQDDSTFGVTVAVAGDINGDGFADLIIGAPGSNQSHGYTYAFYGTARGIDPGLYTRIADSRRRDDWFGASVAGAGDIDGDGFADVLIGANGTSRRGREWGVAYLFRGGTEGLHRTEPLFLGVQSANNFDHFGFSVAGAGDLNGDGYDDVVIGSPGIDVAGSGKGTDRGAAYVFEGSRDGILRVPSMRLEAPVPLDYDRFGYSVTGAGDIDGDGFADLVVGAPGADNAAEDGGSAYVYRGSREGVTRVPAHVLTDSRPEPLERFGTSVAGAGDLNGDGLADIVVGSSTKHRGRALCFHGGREGISRQPSTIVRDPLGPGYNDFAEAVGGAGDVNGDGFADLIIGASGADNGGTYRGSVVMYPGSENGIRIGGKPLRIDDPDKGVHDHYGHAVAGR
jgi:hypothetical protein